MALVSIIMPNYNGGRFIKEAIQSVQCQTCADFELLIADDLSDDGSPAIVAAIAAADVRVRLLSNSGSRCGPAIARNRALEEASGRFIAFLDSDDTWAAQKLEKQLALHHREKCKLTFTALRKMNDEGQVDSRIVLPALTVSYRKLLSRNYLPCSSVMVDREFAGDFRMPDVYRRQDFALWLQILRSGGVAHALPEVMLHYRVYAESFSASKAVGALYHWRVLRQFEKIHPLPAAYYFAQYAAGAGLEYLRGRLRMA